MLSALIIVFRETIEAGLIVGIVLSATRGVVGRNMYVLGGILAGLFGACLLALFADSISNALEGVGQELLNVGVLSLAVVMLTWHIVWMARHGREMAMQMKSVGAQVLAGSRTLWALATVVAVALLREGSETVLFMYGIAVSGNDSMSIMLIGGALGLLMGMAVAVLMYLGLLKIPARHLFKVTGWMIALLAAGMASQAAFYLQQAQVVSLLEQTVWDSSVIISDGSITGKILHTLIGYTAAPTALQLVVYLATLAIIFVLMRLFSGVAPRNALKTA